MRLSTSRCGLRAICCSLLAAVASVLVLAGPAVAAPGTVTGPEHLSMTVSNTTPTPGETVTIGWSYTKELSESGSEAFMGFGNSKTEAAQNVADVSLVPGSCSGQFSNCTLESTRENAFQAEVPAQGGEESETITGSASFTVSPSAAPGIKISFFGYFHEHIDFAGVFRNYTEAPLVLTVAEPSEPPQADLGVTLHASAPLLLADHIKYKLAVKNNGPAEATSATIETQLASAATSIASTTCTFNSTTHKATCPFGPIADGATSEQTLTAYFPILTIGLPLNATATRTASTPEDPNLANDSSTASCNVITGLIIIC
jgi:hypothetical protein